MGKTSRILLFVVVLALTAACAKTKTKETKSGRLNYVETLSYGVVGTHGSHGWAVTDRQFYVNGNAWSPAGVNVNDLIANCEASPNPAVEAFKCYSFASMKETTYVLRMKGDVPEWVTASEKPYETGEDLGQWAGDGHWLLFRDGYFNVQTSERKAIKGLPDDPEKYFVSASPDLETILYTEACYRTRFNMATRELIHDPEADQRCELYSQHSKEGIAGFWLIDAKTGDMKMLELKKSEYPWVAKAESDSPVEWLGRLRSKFVWEKSGDGKYKLIYPK